MHLFLQRDEDVPPTLDQEHVSFDSVERYSIIMYKLNIITYKTKLVL